MQLLSTAADKGNNPTQHTITPGVMQGGGRMSEKMSGKLISHTQIIYSLMYDLWANRPTWRYEYKLVYNVHFGVSL